MARISCHNVTLNLPVYGVDGRSIRRALVGGLLVGGKMMKANESSRVFVEALDRVSFSLDDGDRLAVLGHNGAGKTTLLKVLAGIYKPTRGLVEVNGKIAAALDTSVGMDLEATGTENIITLARYRGLDKAQAVAATPSIVEFSELGAFIDLPVKSYSAGMRARLAFSIATFFDADIVLMDEWLATGDAQFIVKAQERLMQMVEQSKILVLATHNIEIARAVCNKAMVLSHGKIAAFGTFDEIQGALVVEA